MAYAVIRETYNRNIKDSEDEGGIECTYAMKALLYQKALEMKPEEAMKALKEEVLKAIKIDIWEPVHPDNMTAEEKK
jgi:hypothetical protein